MLIISSKRRRKSTWTAMLLALVFVLGGFVWLTAVFNDAPSE